MVETIMKRDGRTVEFKQEKIAEAVERAFQACGAMQDRAAAEDIAQRVVDKLESGAIEGAPTVEGVQDLVEETLIESGFVQTAKSYILYRAERSRSRDVNSRLIQTLKDITFSKASDSDMKRENANIDADTAMAPCSSTARSRPSSSMRCASSTRSSRERIVRATSTSTTWTSIRSLPHAARSS